MFRHVLFFLLTHFSVGAIFTIAFISKEEIGGLFFRVVTLVAAFLLGCAVFIQPLGQISFFELFTFTPPGLIYLLFLLSCVTLITYNFVNSKLGKIMLLFSLVSGLLGVAFYSMSFINVAEANFFNSAIFFLNGLTSALIMGSVLAAMITGHWYLVNHKLTLKPLLMSSGIFLSSVIARMIVFILGIAVMFLIGKNELALKLLSALNIDSYIFYIRLIFGLIVPLIFAVMIRSSAKMNSTQSATGILYATIILILIGETFARFLQFSTGVAF